MRSSAGGEPVEEGRAPSGRGLLAIALLLVAGLHLLGLGRAHLIEPDEGRYADVARSFLDEGSWIVPRANGVPFLDKPPLVCWLGALSLRALGESALALRLVPALAGVLAALVAGALAHAIYRRGAWAAALLYGTAPLALGVGRTFTLDVPLTALTCLGVFLVLRGAGVFSERRSHLDALLGGVAIGLATLVKGPVAIGLAGMAVLCALVFAPSRRLLSPLPWLAAIAVSAPWYVLLEREVPGFFRAFFWEENLRRFGGAPTEHVHGPLFFVGTLAWGLGPGALVGLVLLGVAPLPRGARVLVAWSALVVAFFSLSSTKVETYILPAFPALAAVLGAEVELAIEERSGPPWRSLVRVFQVLLGALGLLSVGAVAFAAGLVPLSLENADVVRGALSPGLACLPLLGVAAAVSCRRSPRAAVLALAAALLLGVPAALRPLELLTYIRSAEPAYDLIREARVKDEKVASFHGYYRGLPFFLHEPVVLLGERNELKEESFATRPELFMPDMFFNYGDIVIVEDCWTRAFLNASRPVLVVMPEGQRRPQRFLDACARAGVRAEPRGKKGEDVLFEVVK